MNRYISDLHFQHANAIKYDNRPWASVDEMNEGIIKKWNLEVDTHDDVYILGDVAMNFKNITPLLDRLNGSLCLILGNHDRGLSDEVKKRFCLIKEYAEVKDGGDLVILSHYPLFSWNKQEMDSIHFFGHIHSSEIQNNMIREHKIALAKYGEHNRMFNVGCMMPWINYCPRTKNEILRAAD